MKANELRIGNLIYGVSDRIEKITYITERYVKTNLIKIEAESQILGIEHLQPIPLTEEWLLKLGFRTEENYSFELDNISINTKRELMWIFTKCKNNVVVGLDLTEYVHELQNIYFALTGSELTVA